MGEEMKNGIAISTGDPYYLGARFVEGGINFAFAVSDEAEAFLVLQGVRGDDKEIRIPLPADERTGDISAVQVRCSGDVRYYYEVEGRKVLDPYAMIISDGSCRVDAGHWDAGEDKAPGWPVSELMIYKLHVRGFTKKAKKVKNKGTFAGLAAMASYIAELGFNAVELLPVYEFDETLKLQPFAETTREGNPPKNYWGYARSNYYFAPKGSYSASADSAREVREMVKALHRAGIEVILEFYFPAETDPCMAMQAVRHWKSAYHIDGFHFVGDGTPVSALVRDVLLTGTKLIFENVDGGWVYGSKRPRRRNLLTENDGFEHTARSFLKGDENRTWEMSELIRRNPDTHGVIHYGANVNGFTLLDTVSYNIKHNEKNGENNDDGTFLNYSWNCGMEGPSRKRNIRKLRLRQIRNLLAYTFLAQGVPLLMAGDENLNTQEGNNNAYSSDDSLGWTDWNTTRDAEGLRSFVKKLTAFRRNHPIFHMEKEFRGSDYKSYGAPDISWHDDTAWVCSFEQDSRTFAVMYNGMYAVKEDGSRDDYFYVAYNALWTPHSFALPAIPGFLWFPVLNTANLAGGEFAPEDAGALEDQKYLEAPARSVVVLRGCADPKAAAEMAAAEKAAAEKKAAGRAAEKKTAGRGSRKRTAGEAKPEAPLPESGDADAKGSDGTPSDNHEAS